MQPILDAYIKAIAKKYNIDEDQAFEVLSAALILDKTFDETYQDIWIGGDDDCGFDAIFIDDQMNTIFVFQSKNSPKLTENQLMKLDNDFEDLFVHDNKSDRQINPRLQARIDEYKDLTKKGMVLTPKLFFVYSGRDNDPSNSNNQDLVQRFSGRKTTPEYKIIDSIGLITRLTNLQQGRINRIDFTFQPLETNIPSYSQQALFSFVVGQVTGISFRIKATELCRLMKQEIKENSVVDTLFSENIRGYLGGRNKANQSILATLKNKSQAPFFHFMNNGLTIICESIKIPNGPQGGKYVIPVINPVIVNGLQTSRVIFDVFNEDKNLLKDVYVNVRLYESRDEDLTELITEATNTQTSINFKDQMSNKKFNQFAHDYFASHGVKYVSKRGESVKVDDLSKGLADSINNETVLKFWYATYNKNPRLAKMSKNSLLENIFFATKGENPTLNSLFDGSPDSKLYPQLFCAYKIYTFVAKKRKEFGDSQGMEYLLHSDEIMSYGIFLELGNSESLDDYTDSKLETAYNDVKPRIEKIVKEEKNRRGDGYSHPRYFKSDAIVADYEALV